ncbi:hypothetical protein SOVF_189100 [Spinacia oleracea]|nr:hypothetical protein SOVF_189100 [Spinacia oleracea]
MLCCCWGFAAASYSVDAFCCPAGAACILASLFCFFFCSWCCSFFVLFFCWLC